MTISYQCEVNVAVQEGNTLTCLQLMYTEKDDAASMLVAPIVPSDYDQFEWSYIHGDST